MYRTSGRVSAAKGNRLAVPGSGSSPGEGNGNPLHYSCLENPMDGGAWWATVNGVTNSRTQLSDFTFTSMENINHIGKMTVNKKIYTTVLGSAIIIKVFLGQICR